MKRFIISVLLRMGIPFLVDVIKTILAKDGITPTERTVISVLDLLLEYYNDQTQDDENT